MKIIHINTQRCWRGGERQLSWLYEGIEKKGIEQIIFCRKKSKLEAFVIAKKIPFKSYSIAIYSLFYVAYKLVPLIDKKETIIHCHDSKSHTIALILRLFFRVDIKIVVQRKVNFLIKGWFSKNIKYSEKYVNAIFCVSKSVEEMVKKSTGFRNTTVICDMIKPSEIPSLQNLYKTNFQIGYIAALTEEKDHITFLNTAKKIHETHTKIQFFIAGEGKLKEKLQQYADEIGVNEYTHFTGFVNDIPNLIANLDLLLFTSKSEGLGSTILDFFMAKKPVVTVKNGGSEELVFNYKTGIICEQEDFEELAKACIELVEKPNLLFTLTENAYKFVSENFSENRILEQTLAGYRAILKNS